MTVEILDLRWAVTASRYRSLRQAAEALTIRQSTLSRRLRSLEERVGAILFERTNGGSRPTLAGQAFLDAARRILEDTDAIISYLKTRARGESGRLTDGVHASVSAGNLRATLVEHRRRYPDVETHVVDGSSDHLISDLLNSNVDTAFVAQGNARWDDRILPVWSERGVVAFPSDHPLAEPDSISWSELRNETLLLPQRSIGPEFLQLLIGKVGCSQPCQFIRQDVSLDRLLTLVGAGWGGLLALEGATGASYPGVIFREVHEAEGPARLNFVAYWRQANHNPSLRPFLDILRERYPDFAARPGEA